MTHTKNTVLSIVTLIAIATGSCHSQNNTPNHSNMSTQLNQKHKIEKIELTEQTRGTNRSISFTPSSSITLLNGEVTTSKLKNNEWSKLSQQANLINLDKISSYPAPTNGRFSDQALSSKIIISSNGKTYQSSEFDSGVPPKELEALYKLLKK